MTYQLLSLWAAGNGKMTKATHGEGQSPIQNEVRDVEGTKLHVLGVAPQDMKHYIADKKFKCLSDHAVIDFSQVNDDYCDCSDGSDEPGTAACSSGRFYCPQKSLRTPGYVPSSRVNDGICDCCDGSDEWQGVFPVPQLRISDEQQAKLRVYQAPCKMRC